MCSRYKEDRIQGGKEDEAKNKKLVSMLIVGTMAVSMLAGCGAKKETGSDKSEKKESAKIGVLVADVSGEEAQGFRSYYENYIADNYDVEFSYTDALESAEDEKAAIEKFASQGCQAIISFSSSDRAQQIETCEKYGVYYAVASGVLDDQQYETYKTYEHFVGQVGPSNETEFEAGKDMELTIKKREFLKLHFMGHSFQIQCMFIELQEFLQAWVVHMAEQVIWMQL